MKKFRFLLSLFLVAGLGMLAWAAFPTANTTLLTSTEELAEGKQYMLKNAAALSPERYLAIKEAGEGGEGVVYEAWTVETRESDKLFLWELEANATPSGTKAEYALKNENGLYLSSGMGTEGVRILLTETPSYFTVENVSVGESTGFAFKNVENGKYLTRNVPTGTDSWFSDYVTTVEEAGNNAIWFVYAIEEETVEPEPDPETPEYYPIAWDKDQARTATHRTLNAVTLTSAAYGAQTLSNPNTSALYNEVLAWGEGFEAKAGEEVTTTFDKSGNWIHGFVYIDKGQDGQFEFAIGDGGVYIEDQDAVAYSCSASDNDLALLDDPLYNHKGETISGSNRDNVNPPAYTIPNLPDGFYRMRHKTDWATLNPGGLKEFKYKSTLENAGQFLDTRLHIHGDAVSVTAVSEGGILTNEAGEALAETAPFGQELKFKIAVDETAYSLLSVKVRYGYRFDGEAVQYGMEQWKEADLTADANGVYTLTAEMTSANVQVMAAYEMLPVVPAEITDLANLSNKKAYTIQSERGYMIYAPDRAAYAWCSENTADRGPAIEVDVNVANNQWAMLKSGSGKTYLYNVGNQKFLAKSGRGTQFAETPIAGNEVNFLEATGTTKEQYPWVIALGENQLNMSKDQVLAIFTDWNDTRDAGNMVKIVEVAHFDPTEALATIEAYEAYQAVLASAEYQALAQVVSENSATWLARAQAEDGVTDIAKYTTNAQESTEGPIADIIDGNTATFFHSTWSGTADGEHYIQIDNGEAVGDFFIYAYERNTKRAHPTKITVTGTANGTDFNDITVLENLSWANPYIVSDIISGGENTQIRFTVNETDVLDTDKGGIYRCFAVSEFYMLSAAEGTFSKQLREAILAFNAIKTPADIAPAAELVAALAAPAKFELVSSEPAEGAELEAMPTEIAFTFSAPVSGFNEEILATAQVDALYNIYTYTDWQGNEVSETYPISGCEYSFEGNVVKATFKNAYTQDGVFKFVAPAGLILNEDGTQSNEEITVNFTIKVPQLTEEERALIAEASELIAHRGVGYPTETSAAFIAVNEAIETLVAHPDNETNKAALETAMATYLVSNDIQLPEADKKYTFTYVALDGTQAYLNYTGTEIFPVAYTAGSDIPDTAAFTCETNTDAEGNVTSYSFKTADGKYLVFRSKTDVSFWMTDYSTTGLADTKTDLANINIEKLMSSTNVEATQEELFGLVAWQSMRGKRLDDGTSVYGYLGVYSDFTTGFDGAGEPFLRSDVTYAIQMEEFQYPATNVTAINPDPMAGYVDALPTTITMEFSADITAIESGTVWTESMRANRQEPVALAAENLNFRGNKVEVRIPAELLEGQYEMIVTIIAKDVNGNYITYGRGANDAITLNYYATVPANTFAIKSIDPAEGTVTSLASFTLTMEDPAAKEAWVGGFDESKEVVLTDKDGNTVAKATLAVHPDNLTFSGNYDLVIVTLEREVNAAGTYTLVIPEATIFNSMYDPYSEDFGVQWGARYNPAASFTFTIEVPEGIESVESLNAVKTIYNLHGQKINKDVNNLTPGIYVINGKKVIVK